MTWLSKWFTKLLSFFTGIEKEIDRSIKLEKTIGYAEENGKGEYDGT